MWYTLNSALDDKVLGDIILRASQYIAKYGGHLSPYFKSALFSFNGNSLTVRKPHKMDKGRELALLTFDILTGACVEWVKEGEGVKYSGSQIEDYFEKEYSSNITVNNPEVETTFVINLLFDNSAMNVPSGAFSNVPSVTDSNVPLRKWLL